MIASGSLLGLHMNDVPLPPIGYVEETTMGPMDFEEFLWAIGVPEGVMALVRESISSCEAIDQAIFESLSRYHRWYMAVGGMPEAVREFVASRQIGPVRRVHEKILRGCREDIRKHTRSRRLASKAEACFDSIPRMLGAENKRFRFNDVARPDAPNGGDRSYNDGYSQYEDALDWLSMANMVLVCHRVSEMHMPLQERIKDSMFKMYMLDTGLLIHLYGPELVGEIINGNLEVNHGAITESAVAEALALQGRRLYFYRNPSKRMEVDFVTAVDGSVCAVDVKSGSNRTCSSLNKAVLDMGLGGILFETRNCFVDDKGVRHYPLFAASFFDSIDHRMEPTFEFDDVDRLRELNG